MIRTAHEEQVTVAPDGRAAAEQPKWRQDFPIDWPHDHFVARRDFTKFMVLTSLAFVVGQFWIVVENFRRKRRGQPPVQLIARLDNLSIGASMTFDYPAAHDNCVLVRTSDQAFVAYSQKCTHLSCAVVPKFEQGHFLCPCHEGAFEIASGRPVAGPPRRPLRRVALEIRQGAIYATGVEAVKS